MDILDKKNDYTHMQFNNTKAKVKKNNIIDFPENKTIQENKKKIQNKKAKQSFKGFKVDFLK